MKNKGVIIYQAKNGAIELKGDFKRETIWATQDQIVNLFDVDQSVVSRHIRNVFKDGEIEEKSNMQKMHNPTIRNFQIVHEKDLRLSEKQCAKTAHCNVG